MRALIFQGKKLKLLETEFPEAWYARKRKGWPNQFPIERNFNF